MNKDMLAFLKGMLTVAVLLLLSTPLILMNVFEGDLSGPWIGFWGSFAGGILGTAGVIYVANLQNNKQQEENAKIMSEQRDLNKLQIDAQIESMHIVEKNERNRLKSSTLINMLGEYRILLDELNIRLNIIHTDLTSIYIKKKVISDKKKLDINFFEIRKEEIASLNEKVLNNDLNLEGPIRRIIASNHLFKELNLDMNTDLPYPKNMLLIDFFIIIEAIVDDRTVLTTMEQFKANMEYIEFEVGDLVKDPLFDKSVPLKPGIYMKPFDEFINWLDKEIENVDKNIISLINELSTQEK